MDGLNCWRRDFEFPYAQLRWLGTITTAFSYFFRIDQAHIAVTIAALMHITISCCYCIYADITLALLELSTFEVLRFIVRIREFKIWLSTTEAVLVALITTFFPMVMITVSASCYIIAALVSLIYLLWSCFNQE